VTKPRDADHEWGVFDWCVKCGQSRASVEDSLTPSSCVATPNVIAISDLLSARWYNRTLSPVTGLRAPERRLSKSAKANRATLAVGDAVQMTKVTIEPIEPLPSEPSAEILKAIAETQRRISDAILRGIPPLLIEIDYVPYSPERSL
jgi:hypothetical protein